MTEGIMALLPPRVTSAPARRAPRGTASAPLRGPPHAAAPRPAPARAHPTAARPARAVVEGGASAAVGGPSSAAAFPIGASSPPPRVPTHGRRAASGREVTSVPPPAEPEPRPRAHSAAAGGVKAGRRAAAAEPAEPPAPTPRTGVCECVCTSACVALCPPQPSSICAWAFLRRFAFSTPAVCVDLSLPVFICTSLLCVCVYAVCAWQGLLPSPLHRWILRRQPRPLASSREKRASLVFFLQGTCAFLSCGTY